MKIFDARCGLENYKLEIFDVHLKRNEESRKGSKGETKTDPHKPSKIHRNLSDEDQNWPLCSNKRLLLCLDPSMSGNFEAMGIYIGL